MGKTVSIPEEIHTRLTEEYKRMLSESPRNPWMTFSEFIVAVVRLGEKRFTELADKNAMGLGEFLKFIESELV